MSITKKRLGDILLETGKITQNQLDQALEHQKETQTRLGQAIIDLKICSEKEIIDILSSQLGIEHVYLDQVFIDPEAARSIPREVAKRHHLIPIYYEDNNLLVVAMEDPLNIYAIDDVQFITLKRIRPVIANSASIEHSINVYYSKQTTDKAIADLEREYQTVSVEKVDRDAYDDIQNAPAVRLTNSIITQAINLKASDIHIEPFETQVLVRYRLDGVLKEGAKIPQNLYSSVSTRIKIMGGMDIAEKRLPQDGRIEMEQGGKNYDFRVSSLPTVFGEKIVIRILDRDGSIFGRDSMGFSEIESRLIDRIIKMPYGIVLLTGPTGSGKTTTLYSFLRELNDPTKNIITVEDPVEYMLDGINQVQVNNKAGLTFAKGLKSILRQDPDIVMVGEIRDEETAEIAVRAAITGHLVLSTLHTNDAAGAITRLVDMGVQPYLAADAMIAVIAQRLVRRLCPSCKEKCESNESEQRILGLNAPVNLYRAVGCPSCGDSGYKGRVPIHEVMLINSEMRLLIEKGASTEEIRGLALNNGMVNLYDSCKAAVLRGVTTMQEMVKTVYARE